MGLGRMAQPQFSFRENMNKIDYEWVREQLTLARSQVRVGNAVLQLLELWETMDSMEPEVASTTLQAFSDLAQGFPLVEGGDDGVWVPAIRGQFSVGDTVRIKRDAFSGAEGKAKNGRIGRIVGVRSGRVAFRSTDEVEPLIDGVVLLPELLEKLVR